MRPDLASKEALEAQLRKQHRGTIEVMASDFWVSGRNPTLATSESNHGGRSRGMLFETQVGSRLNTKRPTCVEPTPFPFRPPTTEFEVIFGARPPPVLCQFTTRRDTARLDLPTQGPRPADEFGVLLATGRDTIGTVEIHAEAGARR